MSFLSRPESHQSRFDKGLLLFSFRQIHSTTARPSRHAISLRYAPSKFAIAKSRRIGTNVGVTRMYMYVCERKFVVERKADLKIKIPKFEIERK